MDNNIDADADAHIIQLCKDMIVKHRGPILHTKWVDKINKENNDESNGGDSDLIECVDGGSGEDDVIDVSVKDVMSEKISTSEALFIVNGYNMIVDAAIELCDFNTNRNENEMIQDILQTPVYMLSNSNGDGLSSFEQCLDMIEEAENKKAVILLPVNFTNIEKDTCVALVRTLVNVLVDKNKSLKKALFVVVSDNDFDDNNDNDNDDDDNNNIKKDVLLTVCSLLGGFISATNFFYWYNKATTTSESFQKMLNNMNEDNVAAENITDTFFKFENFEALQARKLVLQSRSKLLKL